mgnify:CR=1 FL=1
MLEDLLELDIKQIYIEYLENTSSVANYFVCAVGQTSNQVFSIAVIFLLYYSNYIVI